MLDGFDSVRAAKAFMRELDVTEDHVRSDIDSLIKRFEATYPLRSKPPAHLVKARGRGVVWRMRGQTPNDQKFFTFTSQGIDDFIEGLTAVTRASFLELERERQSLNARKKYIEHAKRVVNDWIKHRQAAIAIQRQYNISFDDEH